MEDGIVRYKGRYWVPSTDSLRNGIRDTMEDGIGLLLLGHDVQWSINLRCISWLHGRRRPGEGGKGVIGARALVDAEWWNSERLHPVSKLLKAQKCFTANTPKTYQVTRAQHRVNRTVPLYSLCKLRPSTSRPPSPPPPHGRRSPPCAVGRRPPSVFFVVGLVPSHRQGGSVRNKFISSSSAD
ncbi:hypothetical protein F511_33158 [Dorcoceras hygrometricum]|uniref:Uncharacterized protein n=1 Tax=Dorcoceras hygrometricum TaxID=472368 RepID=A0A2Z7C2B3_9LAMI|nr:hypothetical protein F511_33158 [Dorcoceras hygrometricum]